MNKNELQIFDFNGQDVRITDRNGNPWFIAKDVCDILGHSNSRKALLMLDDDEKADVTISYTSSNGVQQRRSANIINESGLYHLVFRSRLESAKTFRKWVTSEVLPQIRKTGTYGKSRKLSEFTLKELLKEQQRIFLEIQHRLEDVITQLETQNAKLLEMHNSMNNADVWYTMINAARIINIAGISRIKIFKILRELGIFIFDGACNIPNKKYMNDGFFKVVKKQMKYGKPLNVTLVNYSGICFIKDKIKDYLASDLVIAN